MNHSFWNLPVMHSRNKSEKIGGAEKVLGYFVGPCFVYMALLLDKIVRAALRLNQTLWWLGLSQYVARVIHARVIRLVEIVVCHCRGYLLLRTENKQKI